MCAAALAALGMNAQETTPLTAEMWHQWTGWGADATVIEDAETGCEYNVGQELGQSDMVIGPQSCNGDLYANLSEYSGIEGVATPGITVRFYLNRQDLQGPGVDIKVNTDADGKYVFNFSDYADLKGAGYVHLNFIKIAAGWQGGIWPEGLEKAVVESVNLIPKSGEVEDPTPEDPNAVTAAWFHEWSGYGADATIVSENADVEDNVGKAIGAGAVLLGTAGVFGEIYVDLTNYESIEAEGNPGVTLRFLFNRPSHDQGITECQATFDENGKISFNLSEVKDESGETASFIHLNAVKIAWGLPEGMESCTVTKFNAIEKQEPVAPADPNAITGAWFHEWNDFGANAQIVEMTPSVEDQIGQEVGPGTTILGRPGVEGNIYADLTEYIGIEAEGTPGAQLRLLFNRPSMEGGSAAITECNPTFDENGKFTFLFTEVAAKEGENAYPYVHLNAVKAPWGFPENITAVKVTKFNAISGSTTGVKNIENAAAADVIYNIYGQRVDETYRGIVIKNGKKFIQK